MTGDLNELQSRCTLVERLDEKDLISVMTFSKKEAKKFCLECSLLEGSRIEIIEKIACTLLEQDVN